MTVFQPIEELAVPFDAAAATDKVRRRRRGLIGRLVSLAITAALLGGLYWWQRDQLTGTTWMVLYGVALAVSVGFVVGHLVAFLLARREAAEVVDGVAVRIGRPGVVVGSTYAPWASVTGLAVARGRVGRGPRLELRRSDGPPVSVPLDFLDVKPATLDSTARAYSAGRHGVDLSRLDT